MNLNVHKLLRETGDALVGNCEFDLSGYDFGHFTVPAPLRLAYTASPHKGRVTLSLALRCELVAECARCLAPVRHQLEVQKQYDISEADLAEKFPELPLEDGRLDLQELSYGEVVLEAPPVVLCEEDCPGLCANCGEKHGSCGCGEAPAPIDPRLAVLRQLLDDE